MPTKKQLTTKNMKSQVVSAVRKIWNMHPLKTAALKQACTNPGAASHKKKYLCFMCMKTFLKQEVEVNHYIPAPAGESLDAFVERIFCHIKSYKGDDVILTTGKTTTMQDVANKYLQVYCKECHKILTKAQNHERRTKNTKKK
jgi:predicted nucleic-acid-binding Zn-ribbon protein